MLRDMNEGSKHAIQVRIERFHLSVRLGSIFFPLELVELQPVLKEIGYSLRKELAERIPDLPLGTKIVVGGTIGDKQDGNRTFRLDPDRGVVGITGQDVEGIIEDFSNLERVVKDKLDVDIGEQALFYEFVVEGSAITGKDPTRVIAKLFKDSRLQPEISNILGVPTTNFGVRVVEQNKYVTEREWFDFRIEPLIPKANTTYKINVTYRHVERAKVLQAAKSLTETIKDLLNVMEREA